MKKTALKLCSASEKMVHPQAPNDPDLTLYLVFEALTLQREDYAAQERSAEVEGNVEDEDAAEFAGAALVASNVASSIPAPHKMGAVGPKTKPPSLRGKGSGAGCSAAAAPDATAGKGKKKAPVPQEVRDVERVKRRCLALRATASTVATQLMTYGKAPDDTESFLARKMQGAVTECGSLDAACAEALRGEPEEVAAKASRLEGDLRLLEADVKMASARLRAVQTPQKRRLSDTSSQHG